ncbi:hypothetical protein AURDEDRAFT_163435 [Auricularia subglabra TFB-10046 SS5]|nr:hypothetical protein AURDEDRAFT_163435 [Auricularia subglabra TFB-10046 SS5]
MSERNIDPALFLVSGALDAELLADNGPPSPFDLSMIDPALMALYPDSTSMPSSRSPATHIELDVHSPAPPYDSEAALPISKLKPVRRAAQNRPRPTHGIGGTPSEKREASAGLRPPDASTQPASVLTRVLQPGASSSKKRMGTAKHTAGGSTVGTLVPPAPCARCAGKQLECRLRYPGAACNECRRRAQKCDLVQKKGLTGFASVE